MCFRSDHVSIKASNGIDASFLDVETAIIDTNRPSHQWIAFVWARNIASPGLGRYLIALEKQFTPYVITFEDNTFVVAKALAGRREKKRRPLVELMDELSYGHHTPFKVDIDLRNRVRQNQVFWGFISQHYSDELASKVLLPRILLNCGLQPYFRSLWNLDRILITGTEISLLEIKHKFPMHRSPSLSFWLNLGELTVFQKIAKTGIKCFYLILVKPEWSDKIGPMYLLNNLNTRDKAALIGKVLDNKTISEILLTRTYQSGKHTSINGGSSIPFKILQATGFEKMGTLADTTETIARKITKLLSGGRGEAVTNEWLRSLKL